MAQILEVKHTIEPVLYPSGFSKDGWEAMRAAALIAKGRHSCSLLQEKRLWVAVAIRRVKPMNQPVTAQEVTDRLLACKGDLRQAIPGFIPIPDLKSLPRELQGWELPELIYQWTAYLPDDKRLSAWCRKLGFSYSRNVPYSGSQTHALIAQWVRMRIEERERARESAYKNFHSHLQTAA